MKKSQLRQLIREEIENIASLKEEYEGQYIIVDKEDPFDEDSIIFEGDMQQIKDYLFDALLEGNLSDGLDLYERGEYEQMLSDNPIDDDDDDDVVLVQEWGRREIDDEYDDFEYSDSEREYGYSIGKDPEFFTDNDWDDFRQYEEDVKNNVRDRVPNLDMLRAKAGGYRRYK